VRVVPAKHIMKCDDDTFVRIESVLDQVKKVQSGKSMYVGNINYYHRPLRSGKWSVTYEEWPEQVYPPYANGPGYVISSDIAQYILSEFDNKALRVSTAVIPSSYHLPLGTAIVLCHFLNNGVCNM